VPGSYSSLLVSGGVSGSQTTSSERYDPAADAWSTAGAMTIAHASHTAVLLPTGQVLVSGGVNAVGKLTGSELYNPITGAWATTGSLTTARALHTSTVLSGGQALVCGGSGSSAAPLATCELY
jgi:hypothetical protein